MTSTVTADLEQHSPSWYANQLGWAWPARKDRPDHSGRSWNALLDIAVRAYWTNRPRG